MTEVKGNLFTWCPPGTTDILRVITTNGTVKKNGEAVMGRGCALEAKTKWPELPMILGQTIANRGLSCHQLYTKGPVPYVAHPTGGVWIVCFPVKYEWMQTASLDLIRRSMKELTLHHKAWASRIFNGKGNVVMPRPGCGNGRLTWDQVKPVILEGIEDGNKQHKLDYGGYDFDNTNAKGSGWLYVISPEDTP